MSDDVLYVYALTDAFPGSSTGLHGAPLRTVEAGQLQAVVSEHAAVPEPDEDLLWAHEQIVEELMDGGSTILPMRLGSTVEGAEALVPMLERRQEEFITALERVRGAVELSVRAQLPSGSEPFDVVPAEGQPGPGTTYMLTRARRQRHSEEAAELIHRPLAALAREAIRKHGGDPRAFKAAYLVDKGLIDAFGERVVELDGELEDTKVICTGPWPPYSFVAEEPG